MLNYWNNSWIFKVTWTTHIPFKKLQDSQCSYFWLNHQPYPWLYPMDHKSKIKINENRKTKRGCDMYFGYVTSASYPPWWIRKTIALRTTRKIMSRKEKPFLTAGAWFMSPFFRCEGGGYMVLTGTQETHYWMYNSLHQHWVPGLQGLPPLEACTFPLNPPLSSFGLWK